MPLDWTNSYELAKKLDTVYPQIDLLMLAPSEIEHMALELQFVTEPPADNHRENILKSVLWHWLRIRNESTISKTG
jgi:Fe-S-cluster formation regulator IscX/YfhJ